jgi:hypothetical protein
MKACTVNDRISYTFSSLISFLSPKNIFGELFSVTQACEKGWPIDRNHQNVWFWSQGGLKKKKLAV